MKFKKIIVTIVILIFIISINTICSAKYVFDYVQSVAELKIDRTSPNLIIDYSNKELTNSDIEVKIIADEEIQEVNGWQLLEDGKTLVKLYNGNINEKLIVKDLSGNQSEANIIISNIDKENPVAEIIEISNTNTGYEKYANKTHEIILKVKISDSNKLINNLTEFNILVGMEQDCYTKEVKIIEESENYIIYEIRLTNITENGELLLEIPENSFEDILGNEMERKVFGTEINIDNIAPSVIYNQEKLENGKILAKIIADEQIRNIEGWDSDDSQKVKCKEFVSDISYNRYVTDLAGNNSEIQIKVEESTFLNLEYLAHISEIGWVKAQNNFVGTIQSKQGYKIESLAFRTSEKVESDFLNVSAYIYTHWGPNSYAESQYSGIIYNYGYNPISGYKTMKNSELMMLENTEYIQLGGEGINSMGSTDIDGNNPIPLIVAYEYNYGISGIRLDLKDHNESSIIYQIFFNDIGWSETYKNGEEAMIESKKIIEAMKVAVIPTSETKFVVQEWNQNVGTYNY